MQRIRSAPWTVQPQEAGKWAYFCNYAANFGALEPSWTRVGAPLAPSQFGIAVENNGSSTYAFRETAVALEPPFWLACVYYRTVLPSTNRCIAGIGANASLGAFFGLRTSATANGVNVFFRQSNGGNFFEVGSASAANLTDPNELLCVVGVAPTTNSADAYVIIKGNKYNTVVSSATLTGSVATSQFETVGALRRNSVSDYCPINALATGRGKVISEQQAIELSLNPWQLFEPRRIWVPQAAISGLPTLGTVSATAITSSGFRPSVTYTY